MRKLSVLLICIVPCLAQQSRLGFKGVVTGSLRGDDGTGIVGASVILQLLPPYPKSRLLKTEWTAVTGSGGLFRFDKLNDGKYRVCAQAPNSTWLNPCEWGLQPPTVSLSFVQPTTTIAMTLKKGVSVPIRIDDPGQFLSQNEGRTPGGHLLVGFGNDALVFRPIPVLPPGTNGTNRQIVIPFNSLVKLVVFSSFFQLSDTNGLPLAKSAGAIPILVPSGTEPALIKLTVTGASRK
ncbi:MAG: carboxypeptidase-like regulatory domain-containing protein [Acidobacteriota bacterium]|nr:carboxypeptidase-like regulatory domain-containing protein [Acidobacteriota bacterium]